MTPQTCKKLLEMGILQAYAEGKEVQTKAYGNWCSYGPYNFDSPPENYRIKPEPQFEVGDLVRVPSGCIFKVTQVYPNACEVQPIIGGYPNIVHNSSLTKVHEVRTPFTFEQAVKACAEHGLMICERGSKIPYQIVELDTIDCTTVTPGKGKETAYVITYQYASTRHFTFLDNTPFYNISYEPIPTN